MDDRAMIRAFMVGLVQRAGGVDAAAALIGARLGSDVSKGSVSKRLAGHLDWPLIEIMALEDAVGDACVRRWLARSAPEAVAGKCLLQGVADSAREHGEAVGAVMDYLAGRGAAAIARKEIEDALAAVRRLAAGMEAEEALR